MDNLSIFRKSLQQALSPFQGSSNPQMIQSAIDRLQELSKESQDASLEQRTIQVQESDPAMQALVKEVLSLESSEEAQQWAFGQGFNSKLVNHRFHLWTRKAWPLRFNKEKKRRCLYLSRWLSEAT
jgi:hypothetical protein